jgi:hypothetical protein
LKEYAFCKCLEFASNDSVLFKEDISITVYKEIANYALNVFTSVDSLTMKAALAIKPSIIADYNHRKAIVSDCFIFFKSRQLDSLVRSMDKLQLEGWK